MKYRKMGKSDLQLSVVGQGTWAFGNDFFGKHDEAEGIRAIHASLDMGVNLIDTAPGYGQAYEAETLVGKAIEGRRDKVILSTKCGIHRLYGEYVKCLSPSVIRQEIEGSLRRLKTDYIDVYFIHWPDYNFGIEGALELLAQLKKEGKIREAAVSNFSVPELETAERIAGITCVQPPLSLLNHSAIDSGVIPYCASHQIGLMTYGTLNGGLLSGRPPKASSDQTELRSTFYSHYDAAGQEQIRGLLALMGDIAAAHQAEVSEVALNWALAQEGVTCVLCGSTRPETAIANAKAADWELSADEVTALNDACRKIQG